MPSNLLNIDKVPVVDNHCHAGMFEMLAGLDEGLSLADMREISLQAVLQSAFPVDQYEAISEALKSEDQELTDKLDARYGFKKIVADLALFSSRSNLYEILQEQAYRDIYGPDKDGQDLEQTLMHSRKAGLVQTYMDMMDRSGISMAFNNTYLLDPGRWPMQRFRWIPHLDTFIFPLWGEKYLTCGGATEAYGHYVFRHPEREMIQHLEHSGLKEIPQDFTDYLSWVHTTLDRLKNEGAVAMKLLMAYFRTLDTDAVTTFEAEESFNKSIQGDLAEVKKIEDFMVRDLIRYCGMIELPIQIHVGQGGPGPGLMLSHSRPMLLQSLFEHPELKNAKIVLLHGGYPFTRECGSLAAQYWNTYLDLSSLTIATSGWLERQLLDWLEIVPASKILFGTDAWTPELFWVGIRNGRRVLASSLEKMIQSGFYKTREAMEIAQAILYRNACRVYNISID